MTISEFDEQYADKGGFKALNNFKEELMTTHFIANHFKVSDITVAEWFVKLYGMKYDPRMSRREKIINSMLKFAENHTLDEFREAYYYASRHYYNIALAEAFSQEIYKQEKTS